MTRVPIGPGAAIPLRYANRHGLITGPTGTGKTVTLMTLAEQFSRAGVPVFIADVKGDIAALARCRTVQLLDLFGEQGRPIHATIAGMGPDLLARSLEMTDAQSGAVEIAFTVARDSGFPLNTIRDFRDVLGVMMENRGNVTARYGQVGGASIGVVQRALLRLEAQGGSKFFGAPAFDVADMIKPALVSILAADKLISSPRLYSAFLLWLLTDLYARMPEVGDLDQPRLVFFFDEAHLLFDDCPPTLLRKIEQTVRLIRSKGVGIYFVSQSPHDVPAVIREQLAHRVEHDRALPVGTARVATMTDAGMPAPVATVRVQAPSCPLGPLSETERPAVPIPLPVPSRGGLDRGDRLIIHWATSATFGGMVVALCMLWAAGHSAWLLGGAAVVGLLGFAPVGVLLGVLLVQLWNRVGDADRPR